MKVYFCGSILGGRHDAAVYGVIVDHLVTNGHQVLTVHVARPDVASLEAGRTPQEVFGRDMAWLAEAEAVVAEVTTPSLGVGYEVAEALHLGKPVLCVYRQGTAVSRIITGNTSAHISLGSYASERELLTLIDAFVHTRAQP